LFSSSFSPHTNSPPLLLLLLLLRLLLPIISSIGVRSLILLKTTQSGFENFHRDEFRALGDTNDRLVGTSVDGEWTFTPATIASRPDYEALNKLVLDTLIDEFAGPADKGVYSVSVQQTLYDMGTGLLAKVPGVEKIELYMVRSLPPALLSSNLFVKIVNI
jgi:urate oxidase